MFKKKNINNYSLVKRSGAARSSRRRYYTALLVGMVLLLFGVLVAYALPANFTETPMPSGSIQPDVWQKNSPGSWVNGNVAGWSEGEVAPMSVWINPAGLDVQPSPVPNPDTTLEYQLYVCIQVEHTPGGVEYGFSDFDPWDTSELPLTFNGTTPLTSVPLYTDPDWDRDHPEIWGYNLDITEVLGPDRGAGTGSNDDCGPEYYGYLVSYKITNPAIADNGAWLVYGGRLAQPGDPLPTGFQPPATVPADLGASAVNGTFQVRLGGTGDKTIPFKGDLSTPANADLTVAKQCANFDNATTAVFVITVSNAGPSSATTLSLTDTLNTTYYDYTGVFSSTVGGVAAGSNCSEGTLGANDVTCTLPTLADGETWIVELQASLKVPGNVGSVPNTATVTSVVPEPDGTQTGRSTTEQCDTPVTLSYFVATEADGAVQFDWSTATENGNHGFNIFAVTEDGKVQLNDELIPSNVVSSSEPQDYSFSVAGVEADSFLIQNVDVRGFVDQHGPFKLGEVIGARSVPDIIDWQSIRAESASKALRHNGAFTLQQPLNAAGSGRALAFSTAAVAAEAVNLTINEDGLYRVSYEALRDAGLDLKGVAAADIALTSQGASVPVYVSDQKNFGSGDYLEFYGQGLNNLYTANNVYTVQVNAALAEQVAVNFQFAPRKAVMAGHYMETLTFDENNVIFSYLSSTDPWVNGYILTNAPDQGKDFPFTGVDNYVAGAAPVAFSAELYGGLDAQHHVYTELNGQLVSNQKFNGITKHTVEVTVPEGALVNGENTFRVTSAVEGHRDIIVFDRLSINYPRAFVARDGALAFSAAAEAFRVDNLASNDVTVYRVSDGLTERLARVKTRDLGGTFNASFAGSAAAAQYVVADASAIKAPAAIAAAAPAVDIKSGSVDTLIITHPDFFGADLDRIAATREAQGKSVKIVDVTQVYAQYSANIVDPQAIKDYLTHAIDNMGVQMVLLVGGDTYDYLNYVGNSVSFIPSLYDATGDLIKFAPLDPLYVDADGDKVPDVALGRLPVRTSAELANIATKTEAYIAKDAYDSTAVFAADERFTANSIALSGLMDGWTVTTAHIGAVGTTSAQNDLIDAINGGVALTSYFGHSSIDKWAHENMFDVDDALALTNVGKPTVVTQYGCWNTYYVSPNANSLAHKLLLGANGAAAVTGATTLTSAFSEQKLGDLMLPALASGTTIGQAMQESKATLALTDQERADVLLGWTILGVPWLEIE